MIGIILNMENINALKSETLSADEAEAFSIVSAMEIEAILRNIGENSSRVALYYGGNNYFILTTIMGVDHSGFWLEQGPSSMDNKQITESDDLFLVSSYLGVKIQFATGQAYDVEYDGYPAFYFYMPEEIYRLQRRECFRLNLPPSESLHCLIPAQSGENLKKTSPKEQRLHKVAVKDISAGGIKLTCAKDEMDLEKGQVYENCKIDLPGVGTINVTLIVRSVTTLTTKSAQTIQSAGCEFDNIDGASSILLQRYVTNLQRSAKAE